MHPKEKIVEAMMAACLVQHQAMLTSQADDQQAGLAHNEAKKENKKGESYRTICCLRHEQIASVLSEQRRALDPAPLALLRRFHTPLHSSNRGEREFNCAGANMDRSSNAQFVGNESNKAQSCDPPKI